MGTPVILKYRIKSGGGMLFVRETIRGEIIGRIQSQNITTDPESAGAVVAECQGVFSGQVESVRHEEDCVFVTCVVVPA